jgi:hypothetical protein
MMCARCDKPLADGLYEEFAPEIGTGAAATIRTCLGWCRPAQRQRYPEQPLSSQTPRPRALRRSPG